ncbi:hypothetical protein AZI86_06075 [Bdellovibrio bacteriovorus]|uniref:Uncharacterized protein n=1 Tax=Bdellovibrio bacteriovorus TaxID=959 RepID=A0A150WQA7_BDEBC|nr:hypothetical protein [Bdellovibrio bacteriovorus]KYG66610.1 hypothetical protein AZI86_06075 [Bdellovibrio bacteriovorus]
MKRIYTYFILSLALTLPVIAADYYVLGASGSGSEFLIIDEHANCHGVSNAGASVYFIPTRSSAEWSSFVAKPPPNVTVLACCAKAC